MPGSIQPGCNDSLFFLSAPNTNNRRNTVPILAMPYSYKKGSLIGELGFKHCSVGPSAIDEWTLFYPADAGVSCKKV